MLRVTADLADAWIPSMGYADPAQLADLNAVIDERAEANGRGPQAIRRMYNVSGRFGSGVGFLQGSANDWAEQLAGLAIDEGISTFVLGTDDADVIRRFALEVVPAVREQVEAERALRAGGATPVVEERIGPVVEERAQRASRDHQHPLSPSPRPPTTALA